jgi:hypothetical protein
MTGDLHADGTKRPVECLPTSLKGVYSFVPPPKGVDLRKADRTTLSRHGIFFRRPHPQRAPDHFRLWERLVGELWTTDNFILPTFGKPLRVAHRPRPVRPTQIYGTYQSDNWSGCVAVSNAGSPWVNVWGVWQVPDVTQPNTPQDTADQWPSASWVGLNGGGGLLGGGYMPGTSSNDVLQAGVTQQLGFEAYPHYFAWFEWAVPDAEAVGNLLCAHRLRQFCAVDCTWIEAIALAARAPGSPWVCPQPTTNWRNRPLVNHAPMRRINGANVYPPHSQMQSDFQSTSRAAARARTSIQYPVKTHVISIYSPVSSASSSNSAEFMVQKSQWV